VCAPPCHCPIGSAKTSATTSATHCTPPLSQSRRGEQASGVSAATVLTGASLSSNRTVGSTVWCPATLLSFLLPRALTSQSSSTTRCDVPSPEEEGPRRPRRRSLGFTWPVGYRPLCAALWPLEGARGWCGAPSPPRGRRRALLGREQQVRQLLCFPPREGLHRRIRLR
jgi:hypothetical protein